MDKVCTFSIHTLGCKVNAYESNVICEKFEEEGFKRVEFGKPSDIVIINTCAVTEESARKSRQFARRAKRENPGCVLVVVGCYSQICDDGSLDFADVVYGSKNKSEIAATVRRFLESGEKIVEVSDMTNPVDFEKMLSDRDDRVRATVKIQDGCNNFCTYCIIPYARGRIRSKDIDEAYNEISALVRSGYKEIVVTGIHLTSYGLDGKDYGLCDLLERIDKIDGIKRIRLGSLEPKFITEETVGRLSKLIHLCPHFHLSLQSGCTETLKRMNRRYTAEEYKHSVELLKKTFETVAITTDVIVGFCGETEEEFAKTCDFVKDIGFSKIHLFPFSPRKGTVAYTMEKVPDGIKSERMKIIGAIEKELEENYRADLIGKGREVLIEKSGQEFSEGHTVDYVKVKIKKQLGINSLVNVVITGAEKDFCIGETI